MELIIDANVLLSALISPTGKTCELLFTDVLQLFAPEWLLEEFKEHKHEVLQKTKLSEQELDLFLAIIMTRLHILPLKEFEKCIPEAKTLTPDPDDTEYFALALLRKASIWTNDKKFKEQQRITIYTTTELLSQLY